MRPTTGAVLGGRYALTDRIASGGMGEVWCARDEVLGRAVAVKVLKPELAGEPAFIHRFQAEARSAASLSHPGIAQVFDFGSGAGGGERPQAARDDNGDDNSADNNDTAGSYIVMELVPGQPLSHVLREQAPLDVDRTLDLLGQTALALQAAHETGVIHRDIKPANVLVTPDGEVKVTDFGIARAADAAPLTRTGVVMGTTHYMAPELVQGKAASPATDVYALGVLGFECLTGARPFVRETAVAVAMAHVNDTLPPLPDTVPGPVAELVQSMLAKEPARRPVSAGRVASTTRALLDARSAPTAPTPTLPLTALAGSGAGPDPAGAAAPTSRRLSRPVLLVALFAAGLLVSGAALVNGLSGGPDTPEATSSGKADAREQPNTAIAGSEGRRGDQASRVGRKNARTVQIDSAQFEGRRGRVVKAALTRRGLRVAPVLESSKQPPGTVTTVTPDGTLERGETVTVVVSAPKERGSRADGSHGGPSGPGGPGEGDKGKGHGRHHDKQEDDERDD